MPSMNTKSYSNLMKESDKKDRKEFMLKLCGSASVSMLKESFLEILGKRTEWLFFDSERRFLQGKKTRDKKLIRKIGPRMPRDVRLTECFCGKPCLFIPIAQGHNVYGSLIALHIERIPEPKELIFIKLYVDLALKEFQKEQELSKLYDTIRPRAIALSTIHTIHRLLSSTLDMNELIERIARLTSQVMRARYCSIMLLDDSGKYLVPNAVIDLKAGSNNLHKRHKKVAIGTGPAGKVAKTGKTNLSRNSLYVPLVEEDIIGVICARNKINNTPFNNFDLEILLTLAEQAVIAIKNAQMYEEQKKMAYGSICSLATLIDMKSPHTYTHSEEFVKIVLAIAEEMNLPKEKVMDLRYAALLPDTGRFSIPDEILKKRGGLSQEEFDIIKKQHMESLKILEPLEFLKPAMPIIAHHHERYDGTGYPDGLKGEEIPIGARIIAVADAFEAMVHSRPHKDNKVSISQALKEIRDNKGTQFDPGVVDAFMAVSKKPLFKSLF